MIFKVHWTIYSLIFSQTFVFPLTGWTHHLFIMERPGSCCRNIRFIRFRRNAEVKATRPRPMNSCMSVCVCVSVLLIKALFMLGWSQGRPCVWLRHRPGDSLWCAERHSCPHLTLVNPRRDHTVSVCRRTHTLWTSHCRCKRLTTEDQYDLVTQKPVFSVSR